MRRHRRLEQGACRFSGWSRCHWSGTAFAVGFVTGFLQSFEELTVALFVVGG